VKSDFAAVLSDLRRERGISQKKAAYDLDVSQALLSHYENGVREPKFEFVDRACDYYGVSADYILGRQHGSATLLPCETANSSAVAEKALEAVKYIDALGNDAAAAAVSDYIAFAIQRAMTASGISDTSGCAEMSALEGLYIARIYEAAEGKSTEDTEAAINRLRKI
jgi:transcriptional regulator with XRE-family HTH domain